ncbi:hypothetical protein TELCIR_08418 [Teladorsagia circumcincta]|uniref:Uncharacterized protein n=1 Tax=Teladorsagia circumcincta TaxID=45464 RepID=A0A2G9UHM3_TELCI|nr:hypothetical protein TELCIR_08418 [Teladorsagia circumcincta]
MSDEEHNEDEEYGEAPEEPQDDGEGYYQEAGDDYYQEEAQDGGAEGYNYDGDYEEGYREAEEEPEPEPEEEEDVEPEPEPEEAPENNEVVEPEKEADDDDDYGVVSCYDIPRAWNIVI